MAQNYCRVRTFSRVMFEHAQDQFVCLKLILMKEQAIGTKVVLFDIKITAKACSAHIKRMEAMGHHVVVDTAERKDINCLRCPAASWRVDHSTVTGVIRRIS